MLADQVEHDLSIGVAKRRTRRHSKAACVDLAHVHAGQGWGPQKKRPLVRGAAATSIVTYKHYDDRAAARGGTARSFNARMGLSRMTSIVCGERTFGMWISSCKMNGWRSRHRPLVRHGLIASSSRAIPHGEPDFVALRYKRPSSHAPCAIREWFVLSRSGRSVCGRQLQSRT